MIRFRGRAAVPLAFCWLLAGCGAQGIGFSDLVPSIGAAEPRDEDGIVAVWRRDVTLSLTGELVSLTDGSDSGIECASMRTPEGRLFAIIGDLAPYQLGQTIEVTGPLALWSTCQTFQVIRADRLEPVPAS